MNINLKIARNHTFILFGILLFIAASFFFKLSLFGEDLYEDGFYSQIISLVDSDDVIQGLGYMHYARLISVFPFFQIWLLQLPNYYNAILLSVFLLPILTFKSKTYQFNIAQLFILILPFFFSLRVSLGACGFGYLYIYLFGDRKNVILIIVSLLLSLLSSGNILCYFLMLFFYRKKIAKAHPILFKVVAVILMIGIGLSLQNKYIGISTGDVGYSSSGKSYTGASGLLGLMANGTLIVSLEYGNYIRAVAYFLLYLAGIILIVLIRTKLKLKNKYYNFFSPMLLIFWFEGIGFVSYQYCILLFIIHNICIIDKNEHLPEINEFKKLSET